MVIDKIFFLFVRSYQLFISPILPCRCRFMPSCSNYAIEAIKKHGGVYSVFLTVKRLSRCHPFGSYGYDPVPEERSNAYNQVNIVTKKVVILIKMLILKSKNYIFKIITH
jgi:uncharacterized protein